MHHFRGIILALLSRSEGLKRFIFYHLLLLLLQRELLLLFVKRDGAEQVVCDMIVYIMMYL